MSWLTTFKTRTWLAYRLMMLHLTKWAKLLDLLLHTILSNVSFFETSKALLLFLKSIIIWQLLLKISLNSFLLFLSFLLLFLNFFFAQIDRIVTWNVSFHDLAQLFTLFFLFVTLFLLKMLNMWIQLSLQMWLADELCFLLSHQLIRK
jgi:hypothetical protein